MRVGKSLDSLTVFLGSVAVRLETSYRPSHGNEQRIAFTGPDLKAGYGGDTWADYVHQDDLTAIADSDS